jgi:hypothetical protein
MRVITILMIFIFMGATVTGSSEEINIEKGLDGLKDFDGLKDGEFFEACKHLNEKKWENFNDPFDNVSMNKFIKPLTQGTGWEWNFPGDDNQFWPSIGVEDKHVWNIVITSDSDSDSDSAVNCQTSCINSDNNKWCTVSPPPSSSSSCLPNCTDEILTQCKEISKINVQRLRFVQDCAILAALTGGGHVDYSKPVGKNTQGHDAGARMVMVNGKPQMMGGPQDVISCQLEGHLTQDYRACMKALNFYESTVVAQAAVGDLQAVHHQVKAQDDQLEASQDASAAKSMGIIADGTRRKAGYASQRMGFKAAEVAGFAVILKEWPESNDLIERCQNMVTEANIEIASDRCESIIDDRGIKNLTMNEMARQAVQGFQTKAGINALANMMKAAMLNKQADKADDIADKIDGVMKKMPPPPDSPYEEQELLVTRCQLTPQAEECAPLYESNGGQGFMGQSYSFGGNQATTVGSPDKAEGFGEDSALSSQKSVAGSGPVESATAIDSTTSDGGKFIDRPPVAGAVKTSAVPSGGGGGGGGSGSGGGGGGGAPTGGPGGGGPAGDGGDAALAGAKYGGGSGSLRYGKSARRRGSKKKSSNPFAKLFKKGKRGRNSNLTFRGPASKGAIADRNGGNIFKLISGRYKRVQKSNRLLEYEQTNK